MQSTKYTETETDAVRRQWLVAYVQSCLEKRTARRLAAMGIECYLPIQSEIHQWSDRRKRVDRLIIPMMIFVHVTPQERALPLSLQAVNRYMVLRGESAPAVIPDEQMAQFRFMLDYSQEAVEMCSAPLAPGDAVKVIKGPLAGLEGELVILNGKSKVAVRLDKLGYAHVDMPIGFVEKKKEGANRRLLNKTCNKEHCALALSGHRPSYTVIAFAPNTPSTAEATAITTFRIVSQIPALLLIFFFILNCS